jgi:hypothetical protein
MERRALLLAVLLLSTSTVFGQEAVTGSGVRGGTKAPVIYTGPGDIVSGAKGWWGLRSYNGAYATGSNKSVNIRRASDNATQDINILSTGAFDLASYNSFVGTDATGSCTIAATTLTCTGLGSALHVSDPISGSGVGQPCYLTAVGSFAGGAQTATVNSSSICGTIGSPVTVTAQVAGFVTKAYDQSGSANDVANSTAATQPQLMPKAIGALPTMYFNGADGLSTAGTVALTQPISCSTVTDRTGTFTQVNSIFASQHAIYCTYRQAANTFELYAGAAAPTGTASDNVFHAIQGVINHPGGVTSSVLNIDGTETTGDAGANTFTSNLWVGRDDLSSSFLTWYISEVGIWPSAFSAGNRTAICHNQFVYWGTATSC